MRVLITCNSLDLRGGVQIFIRDLARCLQERSHEVMAYSSHRGDGPRLLTHDAVPFTTEPKSLPWRPDIIHGQHHLDAMTALASLPEVPCLYHCHGAIWQETQPVHPRIYHYAAMSRSLRTRMVTESNLDPDRVHLVLNGVSLKRFSTVRQPPENVRKALFYSRYHRPDGAVVRLISEACARMGWQLDFGGINFGRGIEKPEHELLDYDLVFAAGMSAIDSMACGCAVVVLGINGCGPLLGPANFQHFRELNFSMASDHLSPTLDELCDQLADYRAEHAAEVTSRLRTEADLEKITDQLLELYERVIREHQNDPPTARQDIIAMGDYLRHLTPLARLMDDHFRREMHLTKALALHDFEQSLQNALAEIRHLSANRPSTAGEQDPSIQNWRMDQPR